MAAEKFDFRNPFMAATIITTSGERFPLWLKTNKINQQVANLGKTYSLPFLQEISVELQLAYLPIIKATLAPPYKNAIDFLNSTLIEWGQSQLEVRFGYAVGGGYSVIAGPYTGILLKPEIQVGQDMVITLNAQGVGGFGAARQQGNVTLNGVTRKKVVEALLSDRFKLKIDDDEVFKTGDAAAQVSENDERKVEDLRGRAKVLRLKASNTKDPIAKKRFNAEANRYTDLTVTARINLATEAQKKRLGAAYEWDTVVLDTYVQGGDSYWTAMLKVVREAGLHCYIVGDTLKIIPASYVFGSAPKKLLRLYDFAGGRLGPVDGGPLGPNRVLPILSASSPTSANYMPAAAQALYTQDIDSRDREEKKKLIGEEQVAPPRTGKKGGVAIVNAQTLPAVDKKTGEGAEQYPGDPSDAQLVQQIKSEYQALTAMGVQLTMETIGDPTLLPGMVLAVRGLGRRLDTNYATFKVTHTVGGSGYTMSLECVSNVTSALEGAKKALGPNSPEPTIDETGQSASTVPVHPKRVT
jgi:hypothetical protein